MNENQSSTNRRSFLATASACVAASAVSTHQAQASLFPVHHGVDDKLKIGLVGCGGRGTQAVINAINADGNTEVTALADAFKDRIDSCYRSLSENETVSDHLNVPEERRFAGFDCCDQLVQAGVDVVLLATPPCFRPQHLKAAVDAGKHVFCEKPVAVDPWGVRSVMATCELAQQKGLSIVTGLCYRYDIGVNAVMDQILDNRAVGDIRAIQENYLTGTLWHRGSNPDWSEVEYQMRNWLYYTWLSGDHIVEQHIHSLDKAMWLMGDEPPETAYGSGGRQVRTDPKWGNIYDHFSTVFEWKNGVKVFSNCRQMANCMSDVDDYVMGTRGQARVLRKEITNDSGLDWKFREKTPSMYDVEHQHLFRSIREGKPINDGKIMSQSTLLAIMGREACYTGKKIKWSELLNSDQRLGPEKMSFGDFQPASVAMPGGDGW